MACSSTGVTNALSRRLENNGRRPRICYVINNKYPDRCRIHDWDGRDIDVKNIENTFSRLGFEVKILPNLYCWEMLIFLENIADTDHTNYDCFVCFILTHGKDLKIYGEDKAIHLFEVIDKFRGSNCPTLVGKPKLFFIQAFIVPYANPGLDVINGESDQLKPSEAYVMITYFAEPGYFEWDSTFDVSSWFIQSLCEVLNGNMVNSTDVLGLMSVVSGKVSEKFESTSGNKRVPWIVSTLTKEVYLNRKKKKH